MSAPAEASGAASSDPASSVLAAEHAAAAARALVGVVERERDDEVKLHAVYALGKLALPQALLPLRGTGDYTLDRLIIKKFD